MMDFIKRIFKRNKPETFGEFMQSNGDDPDLILLIQSINRSNHLYNKSIGPIEEMTYGDVCDLRDQYISDPLIAICLLYDLQKPLSLARLYSLNAKAAMYLWAWLNEQFVMLSKKEELLNVDDPLMDAAGAGVLTKYGSINVIDHLANGDITKWKDVRKMMYTEVFVKLLKDKETEEVKRAYADLIKPKK